MSKIVIPRAQVTGKAGGHASYLARVAAAKTAAAALGVALFSLVAFALLIQGHKGALSIAAIIGAVIGVAACARLFTASDISYRRARAGANAERAVARVINKSAVGEVAHGFLLGTGGDADHILLGPCAIVVETKSGNGVVRFEAGAFLVGRKKLPRNPISQARNQARVLGTLTGVWVQAVVCVPGMSNASFVCDGVTVCGLYELPRIIAAAPDVMDAFAARAFIASRTGADPSLYTPPARNTRPSGPSKRTRERVARWRGQDASRTSGTGHSPNHDTGTGRSFRP